MYFMAYNAKTSDMFLNMLIVLGENRFYLETDEFTHYAPAVTTGATYEALKRIESRLQSGE